jgi:hypothetical protein
MKAVRCTICGLLVGPSEDGYGSLKVTTPGCHQPIVGENGCALLAETLVCSGSEMLGYVAEVNDRSLDHVIYDGYGYFNKDGRQIGSVRP